MMYGQVRFQGTTSDAPCAGCGRLVLGVSGLHRRHVVMFPNERVATPGGGMWNPKLYSTSPFNVESGLLPRYFDPVISGIPYIPPSGLGLWVFPESGLLVSGPREIPNFTRDSGSLIPPQGVPLVYYCERCLQIKDDGTMLTRRDWIYQSLPEYTNLSGSDPRVVADWLEENNRLDDAKYMRMFCED